MESDTSNGHPDERSNCKRLFAVWQRYFFCKNNNVFYFVLGYRGSAIARDLCPFHYFELDNAKRDVQTIEQWDSSNA